MAIQAIDWLRHFRLLLWNYWTEFDKTWEDARSQSPLPSFSGDRSENKDGHLCLWFLRQFRTLLLNCWTEFKETRLEAISQRLLPSSSFSDRSENQDGHPGLYKAEPFSTLSLHLLSVIWKKNLSWSQIYLSSTMFVFFSGRSENQDGWPGFWFAKTFFDFSTTAEWNATKLNRGPEDNIINQVCLFLAFFIICRCSIPNRGTQVHNCDPLGLLLKYEKWSLLSYYMTMFLMSLALHI